MRRDEELHLFEIKHGFDLKVSREELEKWRKNVIDGNIYEHVIPIDLEDPKFRDILEEIESEGA